VLGVSPALFSGAASVLERYLRGGIAALAPQSRGQRAESELSRRIELLGWFVPAAKFFFFSSRGRRRMVVRAVRHAADLPHLASGWRRDTRAKFLRHLGTPEAPECPQWLRRAIRRREARGQTALPSRILNLVKTSPAAVRKRSFDIRVEELAAFPFKVVAQQFMQTHQGANCFLHFEIVSGGHGPWKGSEFAPGRFEPCQNLPAAMLGLSYPGAKRGEWASSGVSK
jgi:hypothetical protein